MNAKVEYHEGASRDVKSAVAWYQERSAKAALDFIGELRRAADTIRSSPGSVAARQEQHKTIPTLAISFLNHLLGSSRRNHNLGCCPWQQAAGVLGAAAEIARSRT
jgi:plasmid stabilization system protein ParE